MTRVSLVLGLLLVSGPPLSPDWPPIIHTAFTQIMRLEVLREDQHGEPTICTLTVINADLGIGLTAAHCVAKPQTQSVSLTANGRHADVLKINTLIDLAIIKTTVRRERQFILAETTPAPGTPIAIVGFAYGNALGREPFSQYGYVSQTKNVVTQLVFLNADVIAGDSGGPALDAHGKLVGITARLYPFYSSGLGASAPVEQIRDFAAAFLPKATP